MKFFVDTADVAEIRTLAASGLLDGVTTNPSLIAKSGRPMLDVVRKSDKMDFVHPDSAPARELNEIADGEEFLARLDEFFAELYDAEQEILSSYVRQGGLPARLG